MKTGILIFFFKRALQDIAGNRFLNAITIITIGLSILIVSAFSLFFVNINDLLDSWRKGVRIIAYLDGKTTQIAVSDSKKKILQIEGVSSARFISKDEALEQLKDGLKRQSAIFENLRENPLPDIFEIRLAPAFQHWEKVEILASQIEALPEVESVEYGQQWIGRITGIFNLLRFTGTAMCGVFFMASVFIVANTIRLLFFSKKEEFEIMQLVGATDGFIKAPYYIEGILQGILGGILGLTTLYISYVVVVSNVDQGLASAFIQIRFLPAPIILAIIVGSIFSGWLGCYLSFKQFLNT
ncbi:MAG: permease-like cell division protein FtsX [Thermodesulfobacteriota bacterium]